MASSIYFGRNNGFIEKSHLGNGLPTYSSSAVREKRHRQHQLSPWFTTISLPIPGVRSRRLRLMAPNIALLHQVSVAKFGRRRGSFILLLAFVITTYFIFAVNKRYVSAEKTWPAPLISYGDPPTLVYRREDLQRIWEWEIAAGHYPSARKSMCICYVPMTVISCYDQSLNKWDCQILRKTLLYHLDVPPRPHHGSEGLLRPRHLELVQNASILI